MDEIGIEYTGESSIDVGDDDGYTYQDGKQSPTHLLEQLILELVRIQRLAENAETGSDRGMRLFKRALRIYEQNLHTLRKTL